MPLFTLECTDKPDGFDLRQATRAAHLDYLADRAAQVRVGGPLMDDEGRSIGSLLIVEAASLAAAEAFAAADPYAQAGLFVAVRVRPWRVVVGGFGARVD